MTPDERRRMGIPPGFVEMSADGAAALMARFAGSPPVGPFTPREEVTLTRDQHVAYAILAEIAVAHMLDRPELAEDRERDLANAAVNSLNGNDNGLMLGISALFNKSREAEGAPDCGGADTLHVLTGIVDSIENLMHAVIDDYTDRQAAKAAAAGPDASGGQA